MNNTEIIGKRISFYQLFVDNNFTIEIPTIQRDYAQGRKSKSEVRELFLNALSNYLEDNVPNRDLDFVYGSTEYKADNKKFIPLDGQQRLTTLFLLHWYLSKISGEENSFIFKNVMTINNKSKFSYLTRPSSSEFIDSLLSNDIDLKNLLCSDNNNNNISKTIKDKGWYYLSWNYDPTIQSMLTMLDAIHLKFQNKAYYYDRLIDTENPIITFLFLDLNEFKLTEDLYIKMNSRGKPLTSFENFKAKLEQHISELFVTQEKPFSLIQTNTTANYQEYFSFQIDTSWANLFWHYRTLVGEPYTFDEELMNFIRVIIANQFGIENHDKIESFKELIKNETATSEITENLSFYRFYNLGSLTKDCIKYLINSFDVLTNGNEKIKNYFEETFYINENELFEKSLKYNLSLPERAKFHAYLKYLIQNKKEKPNFHQWMRVIHNLLENTRFDEPDQLINVLKSIEKLLVYSDDILKHLTSPGFQIEHFSNWQVLEEIVKAHLIQKSEIWRYLIETTEKTIFHNGQIAYILEFSGILDYYLINKNLNWDIESDKKYFDLVNIYSKKSVALFSIFDTEKNLNFKLERALLTKGDYLIPPLNNRVNFCSASNARNYQRDYSWKRLLRYSNQEDTLWSSKRNFVKDLLDDPEYDLNDIEESLIKICKNIPDDWRSYFIVNTDLIEYCQQGFIYKNDGYIELLKESQLNHYHIDMHIYNLYTTYFWAEEDKYLPFKDISYTDQKTGDDFSYLLLDNFVFKATYCIKILRVNECFQINFTKSRGNKKMSDFNNEIVAILNTFKMQWSEDNESFQINRKNEKTTTSFLKELCSNLNNL